MSRIYFLDVEVSPQNDNYREDSILFEPIIINQ